MNSGIYICANDAERADGPGSRRWVATGPSQALVTSAGGAGAQQPRDHQGWTLGRASGSQGWTPRRMDGHSSAWLQQLPCSLLHAPPASACLPTCLWPPRLPRRVAVDMMELLALSHRRDGAASRKCCQLCSDVEWVQPPTSWYQWWARPTARCDWRRLYVSGICRYRASFYHFTDEYSFTPCYGCVIFFIHNGILRYTVM